ncbi:MAG: hypothetical protein H6Q00_1832 [Holophagaceae bacterium]|nr:hypothetical protein [Holophagaceae bacterium]
MGETRNLKEGNKALLAIYLVAHGFALALAILGWPSSIQHVKAIAGAEWGKAAVPILITLVVTFMNRIGKDQVKLALVFWRINNALPGCRAFSEHAHRDLRIDLGSLKKAVGGEFPTDPGEQNRAWYRLYQQVRDSPSIEDAHKEYLLFRDIVWLTIPSAIMCQGFLLYVRHFKIGVVYFLACGAIYLLARMAAILAAKSFVRSVMAAASAAHEPSKSQIISL